ncbi:MAG: multicopper oxidase family protein [Nocardioides sp.]
MTAKATTLDLGGVTVDTWAFGDSAPGPLIRATAGDMLRIRLDNQLPADTTVHWHGVALRNVADGVPGLTQDPIASGSSYLYEFTAPDPGTYFYHPHVGVQLDRGLYAPLIIDDPQEPGDYDLEWVLVLDDWIDGTGRTPDDVLADLTGATGGGTDPMGGMDMGGTRMGGAPPFGDAGDVVYPHYLINGRVPTAPDVLRAKPGQRVRLRVINAGSDTIFTVALGGHRVTITDTDGFAVQPRATGAFYIGMGERYDAIVTLDEGVFPLVAAPYGKEGQAMALVRTGSGAAPDPAARPRELDGPVLEGADLLPAEASRLSTRMPDSTETVQLNGQMMPYQWDINGAPYGKNEPIVIDEGDRVRLEIMNMTQMTHPMHVHGHTFALPSGLRKDTVLVKPMTSLSVDLQADNPGAWMTHCHNIYHAEAGMMIALNYRGDAPD